MIGGCEKLDESGDICVKLKKLNFYTINSVNKPLTRDLLDYIENQLSINQDDNKLILTSENQFNVYLYDDQFKMLNEKKNEFGLDIKLNLVNNLDQILGATIKAEIDSKLKRITVLLDSMRKSGNNNNNNNNINNQSPIPVKSESGFIDYSHYFNYIQLSDFMRKISNYYPNQSKLYSIGKSSLGRELWAIDLSQQNSNGNYNSNSKYMKSRQSNNNSLKFKQNVKLVGNMHGDEVVGRQMLIYLIDHLLYRYSKGDKQIVEIFDNLIISIVPSMNPDGYELGQRENANHFDLNRNFPDKFVGSSSELYKKIQPEVQAIIDWSNERNFVMSANLHGGSLVANYPFDSTRANENGYGFGIQYPTTDDVVFRKMALTYSLNHAKMYQSKEFLGGIVNGAKWYTLRGGMQDYNYDFTNGMEITLELSPEKIPKSIELNRFWNDNRNALVKFISLPLSMSIYGRVSNIDDQNLFAQIHISNNDKMVTSDPLNGYYSRLLDDGFYNVTVSCFGYKSITKSILLNPNSREKIDFILDYE
ncbi:hypothetical protein RB653_008770 [Dictyostelium firmibasis]|uniref:Peptidase M14 domain-containing protein n=1 Tax=Dictyostelium firmibasis TaxID=79012 RepID=A0AAN7YRU6_9MYCE